MWKILIASIFRHTDTCLGLASVNGAAVPVGPAVDSSRIPAIRAIRSSSAGHT